MIEKERQHVNWDLLEVLKIGMVIILMIYIGLILMTNGNSKVPFQTTAKAVEKEVDPKIMDKVGERELRKYYKLNQKDYDGVILYHAKSAMGVEEVLLIKLKDTSQTEEVEAAVEQRMEDQKKNFQGYGAEQMKLLDDAVLEIRGNYILLSIAKNAEAVQKTFRSSL